jgi:hypothetical protein
MSLHTDFCDFLPARTQDALAAAGGSIGEDVAESGIKTKLSNVSALVHLRNNSNNVTVVQILRSHCPEDIYSKVDTFA